MYHFTNIRLLKTLPHKIFAGRLFLLLAIIGILFWQLTFLKNSKMLPDTYARTDASNSSVVFSQFVYFYHYKNLYPLATNLSNLTYSESGASAVISNNPDSLFMDIASQYSFGPKARIWAYLPYLWVYQSPEGASLIPFNAIILLTALILMIISFYLYQKLTLGILVAVLVGSNPFVLYETYKNENVFALGIALLLLVFAVNAMFLFGSKIHRHHLLIPPIISGVLIAFGFNIRNEIFSILPITIIIYLFAKGYGRF